jgi:MFS family permease
VIAWLKSRPAVSWALYDWGNSAFATTVMAGFFPAFFRQFWSAGADGSLTTYRLGMANAAAGLVIALLAPLLGAIADRGGQRKRMLLAFSILGIGATLSLYFLGQGQWLPAATLFALATLGFNGGVVFSKLLQTSLGWVYSEKFIESSPGIHHAWHMQGHLSTRLGRWEHAALGSLKACSTSAKRRRNLSICGRRSMFCFRFTNDDQLIPEKPPRHRP